MKKQYITTKEEYHQIIKLVNEEGLNIFDAIEKVIIACKENQNYVISSNGTSSNTKDQYVIIFG